MTIAVKKRVLSAGAASLLFAGWVASAQQPELAPRSNPALREAHQQLADRHFTEARQLFAAYLRAHAGDTEAELGVGDAELGLHQYESAELAYRKVVAAQPELWAAHKNLVIVEASLGHWDEFDRERAVLRAARERGAPGISARESDVIDTFDLAGNHWIVREYFVPVGRSLTRYNFERFSPDGHVREYISLESASAAARMLTGEATGGPIVIGHDTGHVSVHDYALNFYTGRTHGTITSYPQGEPSYESVRATVRHWLSIQAKQRTP